MALELFTKSSPINPRATLELTNNLGSRRRVPPIRSPENAARVLGLLPYHSMADGVGRRLAGRASKSPKRTAPHCMSFRTPLKTKKQTGRPEGRPVIAAGRRG
jgi:hypothetical protein